jgi:asparagine synthase (glutamine-hydrolysing)
MCGIAGYLTARAAGLPSDPEAILGSMAAKIAHRGPDSAGTWCHREAGIGLAHRRLAIVDLSAEGHQPMMSASGRYVIVFNGEIYNFRSTRYILEERGHRFRGGSDTEVLLAAVEAWGFEKALRDSAGMFAIALWDRETRRLHVARDRLGKKPLYLARHGDAILFASELKALYAFPGYAPQLDGAGIEAFLRNSYLPERQCIYADAAKLQPGTTWSVEARDIATVDLGRLAETSTSFWDLRAKVGMHRPRRSGTDREAAIEAVHSTLSNAVAERMVADVPLGAFLSGGIDSSLVVALMRRHAGGQLCTFTIGFQEADHDEAGHGRTVARLLDTAHTELYVAPEDALKVIPLLPEVFDEPFADPSQIPAFLISRLAREHITVALSGDGGDESFGGYDRHVLAKYLQRIYRLPPGWRRWIGRTMAAASDGAWNRALSVVRLAKQVDVSGRQMQRLGEVVGLADCASMYRREMVRWDEPASLLTEQAAIAGGSPEDGWHDLDLTEDAERMMYLDTLGYLPSDILVKVDRTSMASGLEVRSPLLDHRVVEQAWQLPLSMRIDAGVGKVVLREILARYLPRAVFERRKQGFGVPIAEWLRGPLRDWAEELLAEHRLAQQGLLRPGPVRHAWSEHLAGHRDHAFRLWTILMLQAWLDRWKPPGLAR